MRTKVWLTATMLMLAACGGETTGGGSTAATDSGATSDSGSGTDSATGTDSGSAADSATGTDSGSAADSATGADSGSAADSATGADSGSAADRAAVADSGSAADTAESDAGAPDVVLPDAGNADAGNADAGSSDAGNADAGSSDAGSSDAGNADAANSDAASTDTGGSDAGGSDAGGQPTDPCGDPSLMVIGQFAESCGLVNTYTDKDGKWQGDKYCKTGCNQNMMAYCKKHYAQTTKAVAVTPSDVKKPFTNAGCKQTFASKGKKQVACCAPKPPTCGDESLEVVGEFAEMCGKVNVHKDAGGKWQSAKNCSTGCNQKPVPYCASLYPSTLLAISLKPEGDKPFQSAGCKGTFNAPGSKQFACCAAKSNPCGAGFKAVGMYAESCGQVNTWFTPAGTWEGDKDCKSGCKQNPAAYCKKHYPTATKGVTISVSATKKPFKTAGCKQTYQTKGTKQVACCAPVGG